MLNAVPYIGQLNSFQSTFTSFFPFFFFLFSGKSERHHDCDGHTGSEYAETNFHGQRQWQRCPPCLMPRPGLLSPQTLDTSVQLSAAIEEKMETYLKYDVTDHEPDQFKILSSLAFVTHFVQSHDVVNWCLSFITHFVQSYDVINWCLSLVTGWSCFCLHFVFVFYEAISISSHNHVLYPDKGWLLWIWLVPIFMMHPDTIILTCPLLLLHQSTLLSFSLSFPFSFSSSILSSSLSCLLI